MRQPLSHQISGNLTRQIVDGEYPAGTALPSETALSEQYGVSRPVVREALKMLWAQGLVETRAGKESVVRPLNDDALRLFFERVMKAGEPEDLMSLLEVRRQLESMSARLAAERRTEQDLSDLGRIINAMEDSLEKPDIYSRMDVEFHIHLAMCSRNSFLYHLTSSIRSSLINVIEGLRIREYQAATAEIHLFHRAIFEAVRDQDPDRAAAAMTSHYDDAIRRIQGAMDDRAKKQG
jgi:GntR family transcriptional repressor for pyruvate dehydrogenase complex